MVLIFHLGWCAIEILCNSTTLSCIYYLRNNMWISQKARLLVFVPRFVFLPDTTRFGCNRNNSKQGLNKIQINRKSPLNTYVSPMTCTCIRYPDVSVYWNRFRRVYTRIWISSQCLTAIPFSVITFVRDKLLDEEQLEIYFGFAIMYWTHR